MNEKGASTAIARAHLQTMTDLLKIQKGINRIQTPEDLR